MHSDRTEHYCTLFDSNFLPYGLALHRSLELWSAPFHLWILCMDEAVEERLRRLALPGVSLIPLREIETPELLAVKPGRTRGEYCWTMTPFLFPAVFARAPGIARVTYLDSDLYFFGPPARLLAELEASGKHVLITDHAYDPEYDQSATNGRFCVQFVTFDRSPEAQAVNAWWRARCLEWCFNRAEDGKFGDQKYLDEWPDRFGNAVHSLQRVQDTLGPWNFRGLGARAAAPVLYHFHSLRIVAADRILLYDGYRLGRSVLRFYREYVSALKEAKRRLAALGLPIPVLPDALAKLTRYRKLRRILGGKARYAKLG